MRFKLTTFSSAMINNAFKGENSYFDSEKYIGGKPVDHLKIVDCARFFS